MQSRRVRDRDRGELGAAAAKRLSQHPEARSSVSDMSELPISQGARATSGREVQGFSGQTRILFLAPHYSVSTQAS